MVGILILKLAYYQAIMVGLLMVLTYVAKSFLRGSYEPAALSLPLEIAKVLLFFFIFLFTIVCCCRLRSIYSVLFIFIVAILLIIFIFVIYHCCCFSSLYHY